MFDDFREHRCRLAAAQAVQVVAKAAILDPCGQGQNQIDHARCADLFKKLRSLRPDTGQPGQIGEQRKQNFGAPLRHGSRLRTDRQRRETVD